MEPGDRPRRERSGRRIEYRVRNGVVQPRAAVLHARSEVAHELPVLPDLHAVAADGGLEICRATFVLREEVHVEVRVDCGCRLRPVHLQVAVHAQGEGHVRAVVRDAALHAVGASRIVRRRAGVDAFAPRLVAHVVLVLDAVGAEDEARIAAVDARAEEGGVGIEEPPLYLHVRARVAAALDAGVDVLRAVRFHPLDKRVGQSRLHRGERNRGRRKRRARLAEAVARKHLDVQPARRRERCRRNPACHGRVRAHASGRAVESLGEDEPLVAAAFRALDLQLVVEHARTALSVRGGDLDFKDVPHARRKRRARRELRRDARLRARGEGQRDGLRHRKRHHPVGPKQPEVLEVAPLEHDTVVIDAGDQALMSVVPRDLRHDAAGVVRDGPVVLAHGRKEVAVFKAGVLERPRVDRGKRALPDGAVVADRRMGVSRDRDGVGEGRKRRRDASVVASPVPRPEARVLRRRVLEVEERLGGIDGRAVLRDPRRALRDADLVVSLAAACRPVRPDERVAAHLLAPDGRVRLAERLLPRLGKTQPPDGAGARAAVVVVAVDEKTLHVTAVGRRVVREHVGPRLRHGLQFREHSGVRHVAAHRHRVHPLVAEPFERLAEHRLPVERSAALFQVDVGEDAERQVGRSLREQPRRRGERASAASERAPPEQRPGTLNETTSTQHVYGFFS